MEKFQKKFAKLIEFVYCLTDDNVSVYAAQASFFLLISSIPLMMLIFTIIKLFINIDLQTILHVVNSVLPAEISRFITTILNELFSKSASIPVISITAVSTLWLASKGIMALYMGLSNVYHVPKQSVIYRYTFSIIYTLAIVATLIITILFFVFGNKFELFLTSHSIILSNLIQFILRGKIIFFTAYLTLLFALFYRFLPRHNMPFKNHLPGAAFAAAGWMVFSYIYSIYIDNFSNYSYLYGSLAAIVFLMLWLYFCMNIFLYGAQINKMIKNGFFKK